MESFLKLSLIFSVICVSFASPKGVPAIVWSNDNSVSFPGALTGHSISVEKFRDDFLPHSNSKHNMLLFMQDKLSMEDFTQHADVYNTDSDGATFHNLKQIMESQTSSHVPSLASSESLTDLMKGMAQKVHSLSAPYDLNKLPVDKEGGGHLVIVELPTTTGLHTKEALSKIDGILQSVHDQMSKLEAPFTAVYTAKLSSKPVGPSVQAYSAGGRHLLQAADVKADAANSSFWNLTNGCLYVYTQAILFEAYPINKDTNRPDFSKPVNYTLPATDKYEAASKCENNTAKLVVNYDSLPAGEGDLKLTKFSFTMDFQAKDGWWTLENMQITYAATLEGVVLSGDNEQIQGRLTREIYAPANYSYHCSYQTPFQPNTTEPKDGYFVGVRTIQLQAQFNDGEYNGQFGQVNDCIGFFTLPIWSALIAMAVLISVLFFGLCMLSNIDTQDRFDDPKGKTIQVNTNE